MNYFNLQMNVEYLAEWKTPRISYSTWADSKIKLSSHLKAYVLEGY